jgi:hypothetical protein
MIAQRIFDDLRAAFQGGVLVVAQPWPQASDYAAPPDDAR